MKQASSLPTLLIASVALFSAAGPASASVLEGRVINGTTGEPGRAERIELIDVAESMSAIASIVDVEGEFRLEDVPATSAAHLLLRTSYAGVVYSQSLTQLDGPIEVKVYESTRSLDDVALGRHHVLFQRDGDHMLVTELLEYDNRTDPPMAVAAAALPMRLWMGNPMHGEPTASVGSGQMPVTMPLVAATDDPLLKGVQQALQPGTTRMIVRYNFEYHEGAGVWQGNAVYDSEDRRVLVSPTDVRVIADQMISTESPLEGFASWTGLPIASGAQWKVSLTGGSLIAPDAHDHPVRGASQAITRVAVRPNRFSDSGVVIMLGLAAGLSLLLLLGLSRSPARAAEQQRSAEDDKRRRISRVADRYVSGEITREQFEHDRDAILGGKHVGRHQNGAAKRVETASR